ncbi:MAG: copper resistance protein CopC/CopD [Thermoleophilia bacterium]|nr:copper resistance protein CopC/CopD [Thermoleophilia bacterium]
MRRSVQAARAWARARRTLVTLTLALLATLLAPASAAAHAHLVSSTPAAGSTVATPPTSIELTFSGTVTLGDDGVRVFAPSGAEVQSGPPNPHKGAKITQVLSATETGTYGVSYTVSSEDGHVIKESITFSVGSKGGDAAADARKASEVPRSLQLTFSIARFVEILALLVAAGGGIFACVIAPGWRPRLVVAALLVLLGSQAVSFIANGAILTGSGFFESISGEAIGATRDTPYGRSMLLRAIVAIVAIGPAVLLRSGVRVPDPARWMLAAVFGGLAASLSITGHAVTTQPTWLRMPLDMVHVGAAAIWLGGLVQLAYLAPFAGTYVPQLARFSRTAFASVVVILLTGTYATFAELDSVGDLLDSTYGRLILGKLVLYLGTMPLAWNNMSAFVPAIRRRPDDAPRMLRQYVARELVLVVCVVALTVWLIATPQPT